MPNLDLKQQFDQYFDFTLSKDEAPINYVDLLSTEHLAVSVKTQNGNLKSDVKWNQSQIINGELKSIILSGFDNFLISDTSIYNHGDIDVSYALPVSSSDTFSFHTVDGHETITDYTFTIDSDTSLKLTGGFLQGFYKVYGYPFELFPSRTSLGWTVDMIIKPDLSHVDTENSLNHKYPNNSGFIFYMGTRAENKYATVPDNPLTSEETIKLGELGYVLSDGNMTTDSISYTVHNPNQIDGSSYEPAIDTTYKPGYVYYTPLSGTPITSGATINFVSYTNGGELRWFNQQTGAWFDYIGYYHFIDGIPYSGKLHYLEENLPEKCPVCGTILNITDHFANCPQCSYENVSNSTQLSEYSNLTDVVDNAFGIRITKDGRIGYRKITIKEPTCLYERNLKRYFKNYNPEDIIVLGLDEDEKYYSCEKLIGWKNKNEGPMNPMNITITFRRDFVLNKCELLTNPYTNGCLKIYSNGVLIFKDPNFKEILTRELSELPELQQSVPFNISWGGGSQGLLESVTFGGKKTSELGKLIEQTFAGTFNGNLYEFKMYTRPLDFTEIQRNFVLKSADYKIPPLI